jgi:glyoxylase-like metal-dependent hydrolase (beta-lactamase superfamily II)
MKILFVLSMLFYLVSISANVKDAVPELKINEITEGVYLHQSFHHSDSFGLVSSNGLVITEQGKAFIVDTPWSVQDTIKLVNWILENNYQLLGSLSTHSHEDRTAGIKWLNDHSIATYATELTNEILKSEKKVFAKYSLKENETQLANGLLEVFYPGGGHTIDNLVVWLPKSKVLFGGCFTRSLNSKGLGYTGEAYIKEWLRSLDNVLVKYRDAKIVIPGHGKVGNLELLTHTQKLVNTALNQSTQSVKNALDD